MSVKNSNILGVYIHDDSTNTAPISNVVPGMDADFTNNDFSTVPDGTYVYTHGGKATYLTVSAGGANGAGATEIGLDLVACATNTTLDISNSINETVCRDGSGASTRHIVAGATQWSITVDGLFGNSLSSEAGGYDLIDLAKNNIYVIVKFSTDVTDGTSVDYVGQALLESVSISGGVDDIATYSATLSGQGQLFQSL